MERKGEKGAWIAVTGLGGKSGGGVEGQASKQALSRGASEVEGRRGGEEGFEFGSVWMGVSARFFSWNAWNVFWGKVVLVKLGFTGRCLEHCVVSFFSLWYLGLIVCNCWE